jgi:hypothetical protein
MKPTCLTSKGLQPGPRCLQHDRLADEDGPGKATHQATHWPLPLAPTHLLSRQLQSAPRHLQLDLLVEEDDPEKAIPWLLHKLPPMSFSYPRMNL